MNIPATKTAATRIFLIGNGNSIYIKNFIRYVLAPRNFNICLFSDKIIDKQIKEFLVANHVHFIERKRTIPLIKNIPVIRIVEDIRQIKDCLTGHGQADIVHVHYASRLNTVLMPVLKKQSNKIILTYWGSDLLRKGRLYVRSLKRLLIYADIITFNSEELIKKFNEIFKNKFSDKTYNAKFGTTQFNLIDESERNESAEESRRKIDLPPDKRIIVCGHTRSKAHQQLEVLKQIAGMDKSLVEKMCIVFPMTYGKADEEYEKELEGLSRQLPCAVRFYREYMAEEDVARLRRVTDIFIHAQTSDAFSATLQEFLYAGAIVMNGSWLKYPDLIAGGVKYFEFEDVCNVPETLKAIWFDFNEIKNTMQSNRKNIHKISSWEVISERWIELYNQ